MAFDVKLSAEAKQNLDTLTAWLLVERQAGDAARRWLGGLQAAIKSLSEMPGRCVLARESRSTPFDMWQLLYGRKPNVYRILFTIEGNTVWILFIRGPHQQDVSLH